MPLPVYPKPICQIKRIDFEKANLTFVCADLGNISEYARPYSTSIYKLMKKHLPGPYTFILNANNIMFNPKSEITVQITNINQEVNELIQIVTSGKLMKQDIRQVAYNKSFLVFGLPVMFKSLDDIKTKIINVNYYINCYQFRSFHKKNVSEYILLKDINTNKSVETNCDINLSHNTISHSNKNKKINYLTTFKHITKREIVFKIKPDIQNDIYHLYALNNGNEIYYDVAYIPDFVTSVMMNKLFRNIKENQNLDALEESDDEEEFENDKEDRFVFLDKSYKMVCVYNNKFRKWYPIRLADDNMVIVNINQLNNL